MRTHGEIAHARIVGQGHGDGRGCAALGAVQIDEVAHSGEVHGVLGEGGGDGRIEGCGAVGIEQFGEPSGEGAQMHAAHGGELQQPPGARGGIVQSVGGPMGAPGAFVGLERLDVAGLLDLRAAVVAAPVRGDDGAAIEDAYSLDGGEYLEGAAHVGVRDGVVVQVEAYVGGLVGVHDDPLGSRERLIGQGEQMRPLGLEALAHRAAAILRAGPLGRLAGAPGERLGVQILQIGEASRGEEAFPNKADGALDAPLISRQQLPAVLTVRQLISRSPIRSIPGAARASLSRRSGRPGAKTA